MQFFIHMSATLSGKLMVVDSSIPCKLFRVLMFILCLVSNFLYFKWHCSPVLHIILVLSCNHCYFYQLSFLVRPYPHFTGGIWTHLPIWIWIWKNLHNCTCKVSVFKKVRYQKFFIHTKMKSQYFWNSYGLKNVFERRRFCDRLVWRVGPKSSILEFAVV